MKRREFIKVSSSGLAAVALGATTLPLMFRGEAWAQPSLLPVNQGLDIVMEEVMWEMVDGREVYSWAFKDAVNGFRIPGSTLFAVEGDPITLRITNNIPGGVHGFAIPGVAATQQPIAFGQQVTLSFTAPQAGTYMYLDHLNAPMNRVMGLHGVLVVLPRQGSSPYSNPTPMVQRLFNDLGNAEHFPGHPWDPARSWIWVFETVDSAKHDAVQSGSIAPDRADHFIDDYLPDYFLISGKGGYFLSHDPHIGPHGNVGQPALIRAVNAGLANSSPHIHGNHVYLLAENNAIPAANVPGQSLPGLSALPANGHVHSNVVWVDTWTMRPGDRKDLLLPFILPPDIPVDARINLTPGVIGPDGEEVPVAGLAVSERIARGGNDTPWPPIEEPFPLTFPMHDHDEIAQTAAQGNYTQGAVLHWQITGPIDGRIVEDVFGPGRRQVLQVVPGADAVIQIVRTELRLKLGKLEVEGTYSGLTGETLEIFAGAAADPAAKVGEASVQSDGSWRFRARNLKVLASRMITVRNPVTGATREAVRLRLV